MEASNQFRDLPFGEIPKDIVRDPEYGVYHISPPKNQVPEFILEGVYSMLSKKQAPGDQIRVSLNYVASD
ncbi:hypothetical protein AUJ84_00040 [Candidatus Pacearchaeota archaeon CG1_02_32_132]|nr:MAG: hypothetical protein AUJ84_00040 [Candidatus Pacearchaeota archaeon CG1_02_32_132]